MELTPPRGTADLLPPRADAMLGLIDEAHGAARRFGFRYVETPTFEHTELFARTAGATSDVVSKEMYTFEDKGGRSLTLRPEQTAGVVRAYLAHAHDLPLPFRAYYVGAQFRHGRPQAGRLREFRQWGVEAIGSAAPGADAEVVALADAYLRARGLRATALHLNSIGDEVCRPAYRDLLIAHLTPHVDELDEDCRTRLRTNPMRVMDCKVDGSKPFVLDAPVISDHLCDACRDHFEAVRRALDDAAIPFEHDRHLVRGLDYYTRTAFEFVSSALPAAQAATICAGGRYDGLAEALGGSPTPGVGFALGLDRALLAVEAEGAAPPPERAPACFVVAIGDEAGPLGRSLLAELRSAGVASAAPYEERPLKAQLKMAARSGAAFVAILGARETADGTVTLRRLVDGVQKSVPRGDVVSWLTRLDGWTE